MNILRNAVLATVLIVASAAPALAAGGGEIEAGRYMYVGPGGDTNYINSTAKSTALMMKYAKPVTAGTIFFRNNGTLYMVQDRKMSNGVMLFRAMRDSDSNS
jgi:hypothetical protein